MELIRIGISSCLLGQEVRFDGGHKRADSLIATLHSRFHLVPVCPEVEMGLGTPREPVHLVRVGSSLRMMTVQTRVDHTEGMHAWSARRLEELALEDLSGYILKKDSPSCGIDGVKTYGQGPAPIRDGRGVFAAALMARFPELPVDDEAGLADPVRLDAFMQRVLDYGRLQKRAASG